jgi:hypothetical protein
VQFWVVDLLRERNLDSGQERTEGEHGTDGERQKARNVNDRSGEGEEHGVCLSSESLECSALETRETIF